MIPIYYDHQNVIDSMTHPSTIHIQGSQISHFYRRHLWQKLISVIKFKLPDAWNRDFFLYTLFTYGYICILNTAKYGVIPQNCGLGGYDVFYAPSHAIIANPLLRGPDRLRIGTMCVLMKLTPDYKGLVDLVSYYADLMSIASITAGTNILNSRLSYIFAVNTTAQAQTMKNVYDKIGSGNPSVVMEKGMYNPDGTKTWEPFEQNVGQNYIASQVLSDIRKIETMFDTEIGIPNANTDKRERLIKDEVSSNNIETKTKVELWIESLEKGCNEVKNMFGVEISAELRNSLEVQNNGPSSIISNGIVQ